MSRAPLRTALVTGASAGLGRAIVRRLVLDRGLLILATARRADRLESLAAELPAGRVTTLAGDLTDHGFRDRLWEAALALPGGLDLLVNNAGAGQYAEFASQDFAAMRAIVELNLIATMDLTRRAAAHMGDRGSGQILMIGSVLGYVGLPYSTAYAASKHAVHGLVKSLRYELRDRGVRVWAACPNRTESEFHSVALGHDPDAPPTRAPYAEPTDRVARSIVRGLDSRATFWLPGLSSWGAVRLAQWLPGPYEFFMDRWAPGHFRREMEGGRPTPSAP